MLNLIRLQISGPTLLKGMAADPGGSPTGPESDPQAKPNPAYDRNRIRIKLTRKRDPALI